MAFSDFFGKLFRKKKAVSVSRIDLTDRNIVIDGKAFDFPVHVELLTNLLGNPRATAFETDAETRAFLEKRYGVGMVTKRVNYAWDDLGLLAYTHNGSIVNCFSILLKPTDLRYAPRSVFKGEVTINGEDWFSKMSSGENGEFISEYVLDGYKITSEKSDFGKEVSECTRDDFNCVDIQLNFK